MQRPCWTLSNEVVGRVYPQHQEWAKRPGMIIGNVERLIVESVRNPAEPLPTGVLARGAKLSDLISSAALGNFGLVLSAKMRAVLERFALPEHCFIPAPFEQRGTAIDGYWFLHVTAAESPITDDTPPAEVEALIEADPVLARLDLLRLEQPARYAYWFVSQPLKAALEDAKLTGIRFGTAKLFR